MNNTLQGPITVVNAVGNGALTVPNRIIAVIKTYKERGKSTNLSVNIF